MNSGNKVYDISRLTLELVPDINDTANSIINQEIISKETELINSNSKLSPQDKLIKIINENKETFKKILIPFIITLLTSFGTTVAQAILNKIPLDQIIELVKDKCPSAIKINELINKRNKLVKQINNIYQSITNINVVLTLTDTLIKALTVGIQLAKSIPYPSVGIPPLGLPPVTMGLQNTSSDALQQLQELLKKGKISISIITITLASFGIFLGIVLNLLNILDSLFQHCAEVKNDNFESLNAEINALANPIIESTQTPDGNLYKGFKLEIVINEKNTSKFIQRYAQALSKQGVPVLKTPPSFASNPQILIDQLKFIIDSNPNLTAE